MTARDKPEIPRAATIRDVARAADVSTATAGRVLGGYSSVRPDLRDRVLDAATRIDYRRNSLAGSMITGRTRMLGVVIANIENPFFAGAVRAIGDVAREAGFGVILMNSDEDLDTERRGVQQLLEKRVDGLIVAPTYGDGAPHLAALAERGFPIVLLDRTVPGVEIDAVIVDNASASRDAVRRLVEAGHRRIGLVADETKQRPRSERVSESSKAVTRGARSLGYLAALADAGLQRDQQLVALCQPSIETASIALCSLLALPDPATAVFATDYLMTMGVFWGLKRTGTPIPDGASLVGFDDLDWTRMVDPPLSVVSQPVFDLGATAAHLVLERVGGASYAPEVHYLPTSFVERGSVAPPRR
jgi:LacI family transcriptional regulator